MLYINIYAVIQLKIVIYAYASRGNVIAKDIKVSDRVSPARLYTYI